MDTETERQTDRHSQGADTRKEIGIETDRETDRQTDRQRQTETHRDRERERDSERERETHTHTLVYGILPPTTAITDYNYAIALFQLTVS